MFTLIVYRFLHFSPYEPLLVFLPLLSIAADECSKPIIIGVGGVVTIGTSILVLNIADFGQ